ncbi:mechanosensitive ion channel domain-containing protein [Maribacter flavus]|uniref:Mechanosensitive ion channel domain-containing protein n=2 Tax=Flavobacteriaceae TaxID=49546 RepID=A0ABU7IE41_9FLAO|nr:MULTISPECIES: mechanosensitive ion channel domain-containing protein [Maribacter]MDC6404064.1 mechanosensitive ion channel [Maribacter sp. PR66]MEE1971205.1 mechanosensitive ion channel domain-containing protein [Maribacter flavus]
MMYLGLTAATFVILYWSTLFVLRRLGKDPKYLLPEGVMKRVALPIFLIFISIIIRMHSFRQLFGLTDEAYWFKKASTLLFIFAMTWLIIGILKVMKQLIIHRYDVNTTDNLKARKIYTQFNILERIVIFIVIILAVGAALMSFQEIRELGLSIFASAGVAGIIIGFSAQKLIGTVLAGIQIAIAQPIKLDDVVIVEGEWGRIEEITLTYVVVKIWDKRRLIVPTPYFIEKPFQNWTKTSSDILGTVFLYTDYKVPFDALRAELTRILENTDLWDKEVNVLQVTDSKANYVEIRALMSAKDSPTAWDLRVHVREKLITFLQKNYPESIVHNRVLMGNLETDSSK